MNAKKTISLIFLFLFFGGNFTAIHPTLLPTTIKMDSDKNLPPGLSQIAIIYVSNPNYPGLGGRVFNVSLINILKNKDILPFIDDIFNKYGISGNVNNLELLTSNLLKIATKAWRDNGQDLLNNCDALKQSNDGKAYAEFQENIENSNWPLVFTNQFHKSDSYAQNESTSEMQIIKFPMEQLEEIVDYIAGKMKNNPSDIDISDYKKKLPDFSSYLGHEMMHAFTDIFKYNPNINSAAERERAQKIECEVHCIQKTCLDPNTEIPEYCNRRCEDNYCKDGYSPCDPQKPDLNDPSSKNSASGKRLSDHPDDNVSYASLDQIDHDNISSSSSNLDDISSNFSVYSFYPDIAVYNKFQYIGMPNLMQVLDRDYFDDFDHSYFQPEHRILVVPSGELMGDEGSEIIRAALRRYVEEGGTLLVLAQQFGDHIDRLIPVPEGEVLRTLGWRQDQSCFHSSVQFEEMHPVLSSSTSCRLSAAVDGYFSSYPSQSNVLLTRRVSREPAMLYYGYGKGNVILTSLYTDWGFSHSQATTAELKVFRDLLTFARAPRMPIPSYDLAAAPNPTIDLLVQIENRSEFPASRVVLIATTPNRRKVLQELNQEITILPGGSANVDLQFTLPDLLAEDYGICHVDFELYDASGNVVQMRSESDSGRFAVYKIEEPITVGDYMYKWITVDDEFVPYNTMIGFNLHIKNETDHEKTFNCNQPYFDVNHGWRHIPIDSFQVTIPARGKVERKVFVSSGSLEPGTQGSFRLYYKDENGEDGEFSYAKVVWIKEPVIQSSIKVTGELPLNPGEPVRYGMESNHIAATAPGNSAIELVLEKRELTASEFHQIDVLLQTEHDFNANGKFVFSGEYNPSPFLTAGAYRLKLSVTEPNGVTEIPRYFVFSIERSGFNAGITSLDGPGAQFSTLYAGQNYRIPITLQNTHPNPRNNYSIQNGAVEVALLAPNGEELVKKQLANIALANGETREIEEQFVFSPTEFGTFWLNLKYWDETLDRPIYLEKLKRYLFMPGAAIKVDKTAYNYTDTASVTLSVSGVGTYEVQFDCPDAGISENRTINIPTGTFQAEELFLVPIGLAPNYPASINITPTAGATIKRSTNLARIPINIDLKTEFEHPIIIAGSDLKLKVTNTTFSGISQTMPGELIVAAPELNFQEIRQVIIDPANPTISEISIPVSIQQTVGEYGIDVELRVAGTPIQKKYYTRLLPNPEIIAIQPEGSFSTGDNVSVVLANGGGLLGSVSVMSVVRDDCGQDIYRNESTLQINPQEPITLAIPLSGALKTGEYSLELQVNEAVSGQKFLRYWLLDVAGVVPALDSHSSKDVFFSDESVSGRSEIVAGGGSLDGARLFAEVVRQVEGGGVEVYEPGRFEYVNTILGGNGLSGTLFLMTRQGPARYNSETKEIEILKEHPFEYFPGGVYMEVDSLGRLWWGTDGGYGVHMMDTDGAWRHFTKADGLLSESVYDIMERKGPNGEAIIWIASYKGISEYSPNGWRTYTTADGLPDETVYALARDDEGEIWASTYNGVVKFQDGGFVPADAPFGSESIYSRLASSGDGSLYAVTYTKFYRYQSGNWTSWDLDEIKPGLYVDELFCDDDSVWLSGRTWASHGGDLLVRFDGEFSAIFPGDIPALSGMEQVIPNKGDDIFACPAAFDNYDKRLGLSLNTSGQWEHILFPQDMDRLLGVPFSIAVDAAGTLWVGSRGGLSGFDGRGWQTVITYPESDELIGEVWELQAGPAGAVFAMLPKGILKIKDRQQELLSYPPDCDNEASRFGVDKLGRIWLYYRNTSGRYWTSYFDGAWHPFNQKKFYTFAAAPDGGVWMTHYDGLLYIDANLNQQEFTSDNSGLLEGDYDCLNVDVNGTLWISVYDWDMGIYKLQSYKDGIWTDHSNRPGYPFEGFFETVSDSNAQLYGLAWDEGMTESLYVMEEGGFKKTEITKVTASYLRSHGTDIYFSGDLEGSWRLKHVIKVSPGSKGGSQTLWSGDYPITAAEGMSVTQAIETGENFEAGGYVLKTELKGPEGQVLASSDDGFVVQAAGLSVSLFGGSSFVRSLKAGEELAMDIRVNNGLETEETNLRLDVVALSPSGTETTLSSRSIGNLSSGQEHLDTISFSSDETGNWKITARLSKDESIPLQTTGSAARALLPGTLPEASLLVDVEAPVVTVDASVPEFVGDEAFEAVVRVVNEGNVEARMQIGITTIDDSASFASEELILKPKTEKILSFSDTIKADRQYKISGSGDATIDQTIAVKYGHAVSLQAEIPPAVREGAVSIGLHLTHGEGLALLEPVQYELYLEGATAPLYSLEKNYSFSPAGETINDALTFSLMPGVYRLAWKGTHVPVGDQVFTVQPSGIGTVTFTGETRMLPGRQAICFSVTNTDSVAGSIPVTIRAVAADGNVVVDETRHYYVLPGETRRDSLSATFAATGTYRVTFSGAKLASPPEIMLQVVEAVDVEASLEIGNITTGSIPVSAHVQDNGFETFTGRIVVEATGTVKEEIVTVAAGQSKDLAVEFPVATLTPGVVPVIATLFDAQGQVIQQATSQVTVLGADIRVVEVPEGLTVDAGGFAPVTLTLQNLGHQRGEASFTVSAFDNVRQTRQIALEAGERLPLEDIILDIAADMPSGSYPFYYGLEGTGVKGGTLRNNFAFRVNGVALEVETSFDRSIYKVGETANLGITVSGPAYAAVPLEVVINWGPFSQKETLTFSGSANLNISIPVDAARADKVFVGVYHEGGKGIYLNDYYLRVGGTLEATLDRGLYNPGDVVHAVFASQEAGTLTATTFGETQELPITSSASASFTIPFMTLGGSYAVTWTFTPADPSKLPISGNVPFDVSGLVVKIAGSTLDKGKYAPGDSIEAAYILEANRDEALTLRSWLERPSGQWDYLGDANILVSASRQTHTGSSHPLTTTEAGTHRLIYGLFREGEEAQLVVAGMQSFDVGDAVLVALETDRFDYKTGTEDVFLKATGFGSGSATIDWFLDDTTIGQQSVTLSGMTYIERSLPASAIDGGRHTIRAVATRDTLTSTKTTTFLYGTDLPDLAITASHDAIDGLAITYRVTIGNQGKTPSAASTMVHSVDNSDLSTHTIPALAPGQECQLTVSWDGRGQAGDHEVTFTVDRDHQLKEFNETNNIATIEESIPELFFDLAIEPVTWAAHTDTSIIARLINNKATDTALNLDMTITNDSSGLTVFQQQGATALAAFQQKIIIRHFNTGVAPSGSYTIDCRVSSDTVDTSRQLPVYIHPTKSLEGTLTITPTQIISGIDSDVALQLPLKNTGNIPLEEEPLKIEAVSQETGDVLFTGQMTVTLDIAQETTVAHPVTLNLPEGEYLITVTLDETGQEIATAALTVIMPIVVTKTVSTFPRPLLTHLQPGGQSQQAVALIESILASANLPYHTVSKLRASYTQLLSAQHNIHLVMGNIRNRHLRDLLIERVHAGDSLILFCDEAAHTPELTNVLGVEIENIPGKPTDRAIDLIPSNLATGGALELVQPLHKCLKTITDDTKVIAKTAISQLPVMALRPYGNGHILTIACTPHLKSGASTLGQLLLTAIETFNRPVFDQSDLSRVLPLQLTLTYSGQEPKTITLKELLPYGVEGINFTPSPEDPDTLSWKLTLAAHSEWNLFYWLKLPDTIDTYEIKTEIYDGSRLLNESAIEFEVSQTVTARITEIILQIDLLTLSSTERHFATQTINLLQRLQSRVPQTVDEYFANVKDTISAARTIASITSIDPTPFRHQIQDLIPTQTRALYDLLLTLQPAQLDATLSRIITD